MYTNLVVIVNGGFCVDKFDFINRISRLRLEKVAGKDLYLRRMTVGQKFACEQSRWFCTSHPVDIHRLVHKCCQEAQPFAAFFSSSEKWFARFCGRFFFFGNFQFLSSKEIFLIWGVFFFDFRFSKVLMVYLKRLNIDLVVVVNRCTFLWIMAKFCAKSGACTRYKSVISSVSGWYQFGTNFGLCIKSRLSTNGACGYP